MQTPDEMIEAIEAFKKYGQIKYSRYDDSIGFITENPCWDFESSKYEPAPKAELKMPELGSHWCRKFDRSAQTLVVTVNPSQGSVYLGNYQTPWKLEKFYKDWEQIK